MRAIKSLSIFFNLLLSGLLVFLLLASMAVWYFERPGTHQGAPSFEVAQGAGLNAVTDKLVEEGLISNELFFKMAAYAEGTQNAIKFGEYVIPENASIAEIQEILTEGKAIQLTVTIPEGYTSWEVVQRLNAVEDLEGELTEIPPEGSLATDTYSYLRGDTRQSIIDRMSETQAEILAGAWENRVDDLPIETPEELLVLASIIEKETGNAEERQLVASVFVNRLRQDMKLQTDPTVIYGITLGQGSLGRGLRRSELARDTAYNTYIIPGLPPTPIANPGRASIEAAANPAESDYIFFVAKSLNPGDGHNFAVTLDEHNKNVSAYRKLEAEAQ